MNPKRSFTIFASVRRYIAHTLLILFNAFIISTAVQFDLYLEVLNCGASIENVDSCPEEAPESSKSFDEIESFLKQEYFLCSHSGLISQRYFDSHHNTNFESVYLDVPYSPPELC